MAEELRPSEVAHRIGTSTRTVQRWIERGQLPARRVGGRWFVAFDAFDALGATAAGGSEIRSIFVANRGEIAARIARTCRELGIACSIPATEGADSLDLLDIDRVLQAVAADGADAVHPGFGFLAENADFAQRVMDAGLVWIGPPPAAIEAMGDKAAARRLAASLGVPVPAGYDDADQADATLLEAAARIGLPLLVKPAAGGGGKGMRTVRAIANLPDALASARREALAAFGNDRLILERLVEGAHHVEIQVLFDAHGRGVHLGERDCSVQRRHQKVLEEAPSPIVDPELRARLGAAAVRLATAVGYVGAGTCEFLVDERGAFTFLEMNTRLQVEHPVTEAITGRDLVADQIRIAAGAPLGLTQDDVALTGHAIEVRLYAEDAEAGFLPATGRIAHLRWPSGPGVRVDAGVVEGDVVTERFDPMLAKIIAAGETRHEALERLTAALDATVVLGLTTNLRFLRWLIREPAVVDGLARTDTLERIWPPDGWAARTAVPEAVLGAAAARLIAGQSPGPWSGAWRLNAGPTVRLDADGQVAEVRPRPDPALVAVTTEDGLNVDVDGQSVTIRLAQPPDVDRAARAATRSHGGGPLQVVAPMPGRVVTVHVTAGATVEIGDPLVTLEAMKMEHVVAATISGTVADVVVRAEDQVARDDLLAVVTP